MDTCESFQRDRVSGDVARCVRERGHEGAPRSDHVDLGMMGIHANEWPKPDVWPSEMTDIDAGLRAFSGTHDCVVSVSNALASLANVCERAVDNGGIWWPR
jgi:hypothetical protein